MKTLAVAVPTARPAARWTRLLPLAVFAAVFVGHALYARHAAVAPTDGFAEVGIVDMGRWGLGPYLAAGDYYTGFSYALGLAFASWAVIQFVRSRRAAMAVGAAGSVTLVGVLMAAGCFLIGCCGSPMLAVYVGIFGAKALGAGKPIMALVTLASTGCGYWCLSQRFAQGGCVDDCCKKPRLD